MYETIFVKAKFKPIFENVEVNEPTGEVKKNWLGQQKKIVNKKKVLKQIGWSNSTIDGETLAIDLNEKLNDINEKGYKVISITPIISGRYDYQYRANEITSSPRIFSDTEKVRGGVSFGYGYGYSVTEGMLICIEK